MHGLEKEMNYEVSVLNLEKKKQKTYLFKKMFKTPVLE